MTADREGVALAREAPLGERQTSAAPSVSVIIPAYNAAEYIRAALDSVFAQSYGDHEVIVVNDGSPDTEALEHALEPYRQRLRYHRQPNRGPSAARNAGIHLARGEYVAFLDSDDEWLPGFLASQIGYLEAQPGLAMVYADAALTGQVHGRARSFMEEFPSEGPVTLASLLGRSCVVLTSTTVARRSALLDVGLFDESLLSSEDYDLWLRLLAGGSRIGYQRSRLALRRVHPESLTSRQDRFLRHHLGVLEKAKRTLPLSPEDQQRVDEQIAANRAALALAVAKEHLLAREYRLAEEEVRRAGSHFRTPKLRAAALLLRLWPGLLRAAYRAREHAESYARRTRS